MYLILVSKGKKIIDVGVALMHANFNQFMFY